MTTPIKNPIYTPLEPLPVPKESCPNFKRLLAKVSYVAGMILLGMAAGATTALIAFEASVLVGAVLGAVALLVAGVVLARSMRIPTELSHYRTETLKQIASTQTHERVLETLAELRGFFETPFKRFESTHVNHNLHAKITLVCDALEGQRSDIKKVWKAFLDHLHGKKVYNADGRVITLDFRTEMRRLDGEKLQPEVSELNPLSDTYEADLDAIVEIQRVGFGEIGTFSKGQIREMLRAGEHNRCLIALSKGEERRVLGFIWSSGSGDVIDIYGLARRPEAARLGIGNALLLELLKVLPEAHRVQLRVRVGNKAAIQLYQKHQFETKETLKDYYASGPEEDAFLMELNWEAFRLSSIAQTWKSIDHALTNSSLEPRLEKAVQVLKAFFEQPFKALPEVHSYAHLHNEMTLIGDSLSSAPPSFKELWRSFLGLLDGHVVEDADGQMLPLNLKIAIDRFDGNKIEPEIRETETEDADSRRFTVHPAGEDEVLGSLSFRQIGRDLEILNVERKPEAARLGLGSVLLGSLLSNLPPELQVHTRVDEENTAALRLFETWKFERGEEEVMQLNREALDAFLEELRENAS